MFYVYELVDPRDDAVFYVGKGKGSRIDQHEREARAGRVSAKCARIRAIHEAGLDVVKRKVSRHKEEADAYDAEAELICAYGIENLTNLSPGGFGGRHGGLSIYEERRIVVEASKLLRRVTGAKLSRVNVLGVEIDLTDVPARLSEMVQRVASRRSIAWVNAVSERHGVLYRYATTLVAE